MPLEIIYIVLSILFIICLWIFVIYAFMSIKSDLFGLKLKKINKGAPKEHVGAHISPIALTSLVFLEGPLRGRQISLGDSEKIVFGRSAECNISIDDSYLSNKHLLIYKQGNAWFIKDLNSTNGTFVGSRRIKIPMQLEKNMQIKFGKNIITVK